MTAQMIDTAANTATSSVTLKASHVRDALTACLLSAGKDKMTPILESVHIRRESGRLVFTATDRYQLTRATVAELEPAEGVTEWEAIVSRADADRIAKSLPKTPARGIDRQTVTVSLDGDRITFATLDGVSTVLTLSGQFPKVESILEGHTPAETDRIAFNAGFMASLCKMPGRARNEPVELSLAGPSEPMRATWGDESSVSYQHVMMPVRIKS